MVLEPGPSIFVLPTPCKEGAAERGLWRPLQRAQEAPVGIAASPTPMRRCLRRRVCACAVQGWLSGRLRARVCDAMLRAAPARGPPWCFRCARGGGRCTAPSPTRALRHGCARARSGHVVRVGPSRGRTRGELCEKACAVSGCSVQFASQKRVAKNVGKNVPRIRADWHVSMCPVRPKALKCVCSHDNLQTADVRSRAATAAHCREREREREREIFIRKQCP